MPALLALLLILSLPVLGAADQGVLLPVDEADLLILEVHIERYLASRGLIGFYHDERVLLSLGELAGVLEFAIQVDPRRGIAEGWIIDESRTFSLDIAARRVISDGQQYDLDGPCLHVDDEDIYVLSDLLAIWWPIDLEVSLRNMRVLVKAHETVPLVARLAREMHWSRRTDGRGVEPDYPRHEAPYRLASWPFLDAAVYWNADRRRSVWRGSLLSRGDLARLSVTGFAGYQQHVENPWSAWLRAGRSDRDGGLLGPLAATNYEFGDVTTEALALVGRSSRGRGVSVSNRPLGSVTQFEAIDVNGDAPSGWDVELYLNGALHGIQTAGGDGHYTFTEVPLRLGLNTIRTVKYGPHGQIREQVRSYNIRSGMWRSGQLHYSISSLQSGESILGSLDAGPATDDRGHWNHQIDLGYGLSARTTIGAALVSAHLDGRRREYLQARLLQSMSGVFLQAVGVKDLAGGQAGSISSQMLLGRQSLYLGYGHLSGYSSRSIESSGSLAHRFDSRLSGVVRPWSGPPLSYRLRAQSDWYRSDRDLSRNTLDLYLGTSLRRLSLGHELSYLRERGDVMQDMLLGRMMLAGQLLRTRVRGEIDYGLSGAGGLRALGLTVSATVHENLTGQVTGRHYFLGGSQSTFHGNLDWHLQQVRLGLRLGYDTRSGGSIGISAATSLMRAPGGNNWLVSSRRLTQYGAAMVMAFIDHDQDGVFGPGDEPLPGVGFRRGPLWRGIRTDSEGKALLPGIHPNQFVNVLVDMTTIDDPYLVPVHEGMTTMVHQGGVASLAFAFRSLGEIEGIVVRDSLATQPLRNIGLELVDDQDQRIATAVSEFDGFYMFQRVPVGEYWIKVVERTLRGRPFLVPAPQLVVVPPGGDYVAGPTIYLLDLALELPVMAEVEPEPVPVSEPVSEPVVATITPPVQDPRSEQQPEVDERPVTEAVVDVTVAPAVEPATPAQVRRILHLIHELLHESKLFAGD